MASTSFSGPSSDPVARNEVLNAGSIRRSNQRVLVTGGCGFIGSHLIDALLASPTTDVICIDSCFSGAKENIAKHLNCPRFEFIRHDVREPINLEVDQIYHLACPASPVFYQADPIKTIQTGVIGTMNMLELARRTKARFLITSTSEVYGDPEVHPQVEEYWGNVNCTGIRSCYDESKRLAETLCFDYWRQYQVQVRVARIFNTYGPRMLENDGRVISNFIVQALTGSPITVYGNGQQTRSFCYVSDMVDGLIKLMNGNYVGPVNLGNPGEYTILQLAENIQRLVNPAASVIFSPLPSDDPRRRRPDITKANKYLEWQPSVPLDKGLELTVEDFRKRLHLQSRLAPSVPKPSTLK